MKKIYIIVAITVLGNGDRDISKSLLEVQNRLILEKRVLLKEKSKIEEKILKQETIISTIERMRRFLKELENKENSLPKLRLKLKTVNRKIIRINSEINSMESNGNERYYYKYKDNIKTVSNSKNRICLTGTLNIRSIFKPYAIMGKVNENEILYDLGDRKTITITRNGIQDTFIGMRVKVSDDKGRNITECYIIASKQYQKPCN
jgi:hypothetical protein